MPMPKIPGYKNEVDKNKYTFENRKLIKKLLKSPLRIKIAQELMRQDGKYFIVDVSQYDLQNKLKDRINGIVSAFKIVLEDGACPSRENVEALVNMEPMTLFDIVRLHFAFIDDGLRGFEIEPYIEYCNLRNGFSHSSVVPMIHAFDPKIVSPVMEKASLSVPVLAKKMSERTKGLSHHKHQEALSHLLYGYKIGDGKKRFRKKGGIFRISHKHASLIHSSIQCIASGSIEVPPLEELLPINHRDISFGWKNGSKPLERRLGAIY